MTVKLVGTSCDTSSGTYTGGSDIYTLFTASSSGSLSEIKVNVSGSGNVKVAVYDSSGNRLAKQDTSTAVTAGWNTISLESACNISSGSSYWLCVISDVQIIYYYSTTRTWRFRNSTYSSFIWPSSMPSMTEYTTSEMLVQGWGTISLSLSPSSIASALALGSPTLKLSLTPSAIASVLAFGSPSIAIGGSQTVTPSGVASLLAFGTPALRYPQAISPSGIASGLIFGSPAVSGGGIFPRGIASAPAFGAPVIVRYGVHVIIEAKYFQSSPGINRAFVAGAKLDGSPVYGSAINSAEASLVGERLEVEHNTAVTSASVAASAAEAILAKARLDGAEAVITLPPHCGLELWDVITIIDSLCNQSGNYRVSAYSLDFDAHKTIFLQRLTLSSP